MAKFRCLNCKRDWQRDVLTPERLKDLDMKTCPFCRSFWTELVPDAEIKLNGLKVSKELLESFKANLVSGFLRKKAIDESLALGAKIGNPPPTKNNFIIWLLTRDGVEIRQKYANTRFRPEEYLKPSPLGPEFVQIEYEVEGGSWNAAQIRKDRIIDFLITEGAVDCENIHRIPEGI